MLLWHELIPKSRIVDWHAYPTLTQTFYRGDLQVALELYRKAETYVPDNSKLKERWILFVIHVFLLKLAHKRSRL
jgi:kinesin family protein 22